MLILTIGLTFLAVSHAQDKGDELSPRIWYGKRADIRDYPFYAGLVYENKFICGAAILSNRWLATAGHCYNSSYLELKAFVWVGAETKESAKHYKVDLEILHPDYIQTRIQNRGLVLNDIALLRVNRPLIFSDKVKPIRLPRYDYKVNVLHSFAGFGTDETGNLPKYLMEVTTRTRGISEFLKDFDKTEKLRRLEPLISSVIICAKRDGGMPSLCHGDSGSALVHDNTLVGLASFLGNIKGDCGVPKCILLTNVFAFVDWIKSVTGLP